MATSVIVLMATKIKTSLGKLKGINPDKFALIEDMLDWLNNVNA